MNILTMVFYKIGTHAITKCPKDNKQYIRTDVPVFFAEHQDRNTKTSQYKSNYIMPSERCSKKKHAEHQCKNRCKTIENPCHCTSYSRFRNGKQHCRNTIAQQYH